MDDITLHFKTITATTTPVIIADLVDELQAAGIIVNRAKTSTRTRGHSRREKAPRRSRSIPIAEEGIIVVGVPIGTDDFVKGFAADVITNGGAEELARLLARILDKPS